MIRQLHITLLCLCAASIAQAQEIQSGTHVVIQPGTKLATTQTISIDKGAVLDNSGTVYMAADLYAKDVQLLNGNFIANGKKDQTIGGTDSLAFSNLTLNNGRSLNLASGVRIMNELNLQSGVLHAGSTTPISFASTAKSPAESIDGYIYGTAVMEPRNIGTGRMDFLGTAISAGTDLGSVSMVRNTGDDAVMNIGAGKSIAANWQINTSVPNAQGHDVAFSWVSVFDNNLDMNIIRLFGNVKFDLARYVRLDARSTTGALLTTNPLTQQHTYTRMGLDYVDRKYTFGTMADLVNGVDNIKITTFPNPATSQISLLLENFEVWAAYVQIRLTDAYGKVISENTYPSNGNLVTIDGLDALTPGIYRLFIVRGQKVATVNFFKN